MKAYNTLTRKGKLARLRNAEKALQQFRAASAALKPHSGHGEVIAGIGEVCRHPDKLKTCTNWASQLCCSLLADIRAERERLDNPRPVSTHEVARRGNMIVRAGGDRVALYINGERVRVWHAYARAGYTTQEAAIELLAWGENKQKE